MIKFIRNNIQSFGVKLIAGVVTVVMLGFGVTTYRSQGINTLVTIGGYEVKLERYQRALSRTEQAIKAKYQERAADYMKLVNVKRQTLSQLTAAVMILKSAEANGMAVSDEELAHEIYNDHSFITDGRFDKEKYESILENNRIDKLDYEKEFRENLLSKKFFRFLNSDQLVSVKSLSSEYKRFNSEIEIQAIEFLPETFSDSLKLSEKEIQDYYDAHKKDFMRKPKITISYFTLDLEHVKKKTQVRNKEIQQYYQSNQDEFTSKESFLLKQILIAVPDDGNVEETQASLKKAEEVHEKLLKNPKSFAALSRKYSSDPLSANEGGNLGWLEKGEFPLTGKFEKAVGKLEVNEISEPFLTVQGYRIVELSDRKPARTEPLEKVRTKIADEIMAKKAQRRLKNKVAKLSESLKIKTLADVAGSLDKKVVKSQPFDESGNVSPDIQSPQFYYRLKSGRAKDKGHFDLPEKDGFIVYEIENIAEPEARPLKEIREDIKLLAENEKLSKTIQSKLKRYSLEIKTQEQFDELASQLKLKPSHIKFKLSDVEIPSVNAGQLFKAEVFQMKPNQFKVVSENNRHFLVHLIAKKEESIKEEDEESIEMLKDAIRQEKAEMLLYALLGEAQRKIDVEYNESLLKALDIK